MPTSVRKQNNIEIGKIRDIKKKTSKHHQISDDGAGHKKKSRRRSLTVRALRHGHHDASHTRFEQNES